MSEKAKGIVGKSPKHKDASQQVNNNEQPFFGHFMMETMGSKNPSKTQYPKKLQIMTPLNGEIATLLEFNKRAVTKMKTDCLTKALCQVRSKS